MPQITVLLMPWGRVGSNLVNSIVQKSRSCRVWNEPLTAVRTKVIGGGGTQPDVWPAQLEWMREHIGKSNEERIFLNLNANALGDAAAFKDYMAGFSPNYLILDRHDDLATAVSALRTRAWVNEAAEKGETRSWSIPKGLEVQFRPFINPLNLKAAFANIERGRNNIAEITQDAGAKSFFYEQLVEDMKSVITEILAEAGIPAYDFKVTSGKFGSTKLSDMVENAEELMQIATERGISTELSV